PAPLRTAPPAADRPEPLAGRALSRIAAGHGRRRPSRSSPSAHGGRGVGTGDGRGVAAPGAGCARPRRRDEQACARRPRVPPTEVPALVSEPVLRREAAAATL